MREINHILFPTDFSACARSAIRYALALARKYGAELHLLHVSLAYDHDTDHPDRPVPDTLEILEKPEPYVHRRMMDALGRLKEQEVPVHQVQVHGLTEVSCILAYLKEQVIDTIVMGTHGRRGFKRWLLGSVAEEVIRLAPCPVLTLKEDWGGSLDGLKKILIPLDFSGSSRIALREGCWMAEQFGASLQVLHVIPEPFLQDLYGTPSNRNQQEETRDRARNIMKSMLEEDGATVPADIFVAAGHPAQEILVFAESGGTDLIFMAHRGHAQVPDRILGSVTEHVVRAAHCPVFTADIGD